MLCFAVNSRSAAPEDVPGEGEQLRADLCQAFAKLKGAGSSVIGHSALAMLCHIGQPGDDYHLVFDCQALQRAPDKYYDLFGEHTGIMLKSIRQADLVAHFDARCLNEFGK